jgi:hypothetical protein
MLTLVEHVLAAWGLVALVAIAVVALSARIIRGYRD